MIFAPVPDAVSLKGPLLPSVKTDWYTIGPVPFRETLGMLAVVLACLTVSISVESTKLDVSLAVPIYPEVSSMVRGSASS